MISLEKENDLADELVNRILEDLKNYGKGKPSQVEEALRSPGVYRALAKLHGAYMIHNDEHILSLMAFQLGAYTALSIQKIKELK